MILCILHDYTMVKKTCGILIIRNYLANGVVIKIYFFHHTNFYFRSYCSRYSLFNCKIQNMISISKFQLLLCILLSSAMVLRAQSDANTMVVSDTTKTLFSKVKISTLGIYVAPEAQYSQMASEFTLLHGASLMAIVNKKFAVGATFTSNQRSFTPKEINANEALGLRYRSSGLRLEYSFSPHKLIHLSIPITLGFGHASVDSINAVLRDYDHDRDGRSGRREFRNGSSFGYIQPALNLDVNVFKYGKCFIGAGYRINVYTEENTSALVNLTNAQLSGLTIQTGLKLGIFGVNVKRKPKENQ